MSTQTQGFTSGSSSKDRLLSTRNLLKRKKIQLESYNCVLCRSNSEETVQYYTCCWTDLSPNMLDIEWLINVTNFYQALLAFPEALLQIRDQSHPHFF
jgi:hypothetical protein